MVQSLTLHLPVQGIWIQSLVGELRRYMPHSQKTKTENRSVNGTNSVKTKKGIHIKKKIFKKKHKKPDDRRD